MTSKTIQIFKSLKKNQRPIDIKEKIEKFCMQISQSAKDSLCQAGSARKKKLALSGLLKEIENYGVNVAHHGQFNGTCDFFPQFYLRGKLSVVIKHNAVNSFLSEQ